MKRSLIAVPVFLALVLSAVPALAGFPGDTPDRFQFVLGGMATTLDTQASLGRKGSTLSATINFESTGGLPGSATVFRGEGWWRFTKRQYLDFGYFGVTRTADRELKEDISYGDYVFKAGAELHSKFGSSFPYAGYRYDFLHLDEVRISGSAGISYMDMYAELAASGNVTDQNGNELSGEKDAKGSLQFPVPMLGLRLDWKIARRSTIEFYSRFIYADFQGLRGNVTDVSARYFWHPFEHVGFGGGFERTAINIPEYNNGDKTSRFGYSISGVSLYVKMAF
jgi:hypothetical protein